MEFEVHTLAETERLGRALGTLLKAGDIVCLSGQLGAGKTTFTRGIAAGWGTQDLVTSPTFALVNQYTHPEHDTPFFHLDAYRLASAQDVYTLAFDDILDAEGVLVIEWPERIRSALPKDALWVTLETKNENSRLFTLQAEGPRSAHLLRELNDSYSI